jgi:hypothetical protein
MRSPEELGLRSDLGVWRNYYTSVACLPEIQEPSMLDKPRLGVVGGGLCGSILAARLSGQYAVTVFERSNRVAPLLGEVACDAGGINSSINRGQGLGGTTHYWHNALIELGEDDLRAAGIDASHFRPYYEAAWRFFLSATERESYMAILDEGQQRLEGRMAIQAPMIVPFVRQNVWELARRTFPGPAVEVRYGEVLGIEAPSIGPVRVVTGTEGATAATEVDRLVLCAGGMGTPLLLGRSFRRGEFIAGGYHDHPMAYVAKVALKPGSDLGRISCRNTPDASVRTGMVYTHGGMKSVFYLRPALNLGLASISGDARYVLSDLRNDPFSLTKILRLLGNVEAIREGLLFKAKREFSGRHFSVLMLGEQAPTASRGIHFPAGDGQPRLAWEVQSEERAAWDAGLQQFLADFGDEIADVRRIPADAWEFRTGAHHSGASRDFLVPPSDAPLDLFRVSDAPEVFVCDGSMLRAGGIANSGLTLAALAFQLADALHDPIG